jgi:hypothetical protein
MFLFDEVERSPARNWANDLYGLSNNIPVDNTARRGPEDFLACLKLKGSGDVTSF